MIKNYTYIISILYCANIQPRPQIGVDYIVIFIKRNNSVDKLEDWELVANRESFTASVDLSKKKLLDIFGYYELGEKKSCGIKSCRTPHKKGLLVVTEDGIETNIGHKCGANIFGVQFEKLAAELINKVNYFKSLTAIKEAKTKVWDYYNKAATLTIGERNLHWVAHKILDVKDVNIIGRASYSQIMKLAGSGKDKIIVSRRKNKEESDLDDVMKSNVYESDFPSEDDSSGNTKPKYENVVIGTLQHCDSVLIDYDVALIYERDIKQVIDTLSSCEPDKMHTNKLIALHNKVSRLEERISFVSDRIKKSRIFLTQKNFAAFAFKIDGQRNVSFKDKELLASFISSLPET